MKLTRYDLLIGQAQGGAGLAEPECRVRPEHAHAMSWNQLVITSGLHPMTYYYRRHRYNMTPLEAIRTPVRPSGGVVMPLSDICRLVGISPSLFNQRRAQGKSFREALFTPVRKRKRRKAP